MADETGSDIVKSIVTAIIRAGVVAVGAFLATKGWIEPGVLTDARITAIAIGAAGIVIALAWAVYNKLKTKNLVIAAREAQPGVPMAAIKARADEKPLLTTEVKEPVKGVVE